ncbi:MAG TPA: response regulator [Chloroflexota bacterium]|nr:response regulator [Chloroflexota bacterium]
MPANILIVEGDNSTARTLHDLLEIHGHHVVALMDPEQVTDIAREIQPDLAIVSLMVPPLTGIEVVERLRAAGFDSLPVIGTTSSSLMEEIGEAADMFEEIVVYDRSVASPDIDRLMDTIAEHLDRSVAT